MCVVCVCGFDGGFVCLFSYDRVFVVHEGWVFVLLTYMADG